MITECVGIGQGVCKRPVRIVTSPFAKRIRPGVALRVFITHIIEIIIVVVIYYTAKAGTNCKMSQEINFGKNVPGDVPIMYLIVFRAINVGIWISCVTKAISSAGSGYKLTIVGIDSPARF